MAYLNTNGDAIDRMNIQSSEAEFYEIRIFTSDACPAIADIHTESGDVYVEDSCHGVILTSPNGTCYRIRVDDNGNLFTEQVACP